MNDIALEIKDLDVGIPLTQIMKQIVLLMFADDIVLLSNPSSEQQTVINKVSDWYEH